MRAACCGGLTWAFSGGAAGGAVRARALPHPVLHTPPRGHVAHASGRGRGWGDGGVVSGCTLNEG
eukprot:12376691-Alexandrium_andersonii.AAC.1